ncbi:MAG: YezD family protein [Actinomycetota bacterium]
MVDDVPDPSIQQRLADLTDDERLVLAKVADIVRKIQYGTVVLVIQDGKVVQIEMAEKFRLR